MNKPPAFQLYADDLISGTLKFSDAELGLYMRLLCAQWNEGSLPDDDGELASYGKGRTPLARVKAKFDKGPDNRLRNARMERVRKEQEEHRAERSESGKKGAEKRWQSHGSANGSANGSAIGEPLAQGMATPMAKNGSPSPTPSPEDRKERERGNFPQCPPMTRTEFNTLCQLRAVPADCAEWFWNTHDAVNWLDGQKRPIQKVEPLLMRTLASWRASGEAASGKATHGTSPATKRPKTPMDLKAIIQAKETLAGEIRKKHCSDVAMGDSWTNAEKKSEYFKLKREIKELNTQISSMA